MEEVLSKNISVYTADDEDACWRFAELMPYAIYAVLNGRYMYCNRSGANLLGFRNSSEVLGRYIKEFIPTFILEKLEKSITVPIEEDMVYPIFESKLVKVDGTIMDVEIASSPFNYKEQKVIYLIVRDITGSNKIKNSFVESEDKYKTLVEMLPDAICLRSNNKITYVNMNAVKVLGCEKSEDIIGKDITDFIVPYPAGKVDISDYDNELNERGYIPFREDCYTRKADGAVLQRETAIKLISSEQSSAYLVISRDISERKQTEELKKYMEERARKFDQAAEYDKLRTEFFANISHEFRTPLNVILSAIQLSDVVLNDAPPSECRDKINRYMGLMKQNCYRLIRLVNNFIDIAKIDSGYFKISPEECNIVTIIEDITLSVKDYIEDKGIGLTFDTDSEEIIMTCDPEKIERIMLNLLSNSLKFTDSPGKITVNVFDRSDKVLISVKDTGIGIPQDKKTIIFDRFQQVDKSFTRNHEGSGMGLSLVKSLVEMHGGSIRLNSLYDKGSEFIVELPINNFLDKKPIDKKRLGNQSKSEKISIEFSDIYF